MSDKALHQLTTAPSLGDADLAYIQKMTGGAPTGDYKATLAALAAYVATKLTNQGLGEVSQSGDVTLTTASGANVINFNTLRDFSAPFDVSGAGQYTISVEGLFEIYFKMTFKNLTTGDLVLRIFLEDNGTLIAGSEHFVHIHRLTLGDQATTLGSLTFSGVAGRTIQLKVQPYYTASAGSYTVIRNSYLTIKKL